jgi:long-chain acyl-CoA synthetase
VSANFVRLLEAAVRRDPRAAALVWDGGSMTREELSHRAGGLARTLAGRGVSAGDTIAVPIGNRWSLAAALWGGLKLGATIAPLNPRLTADERARTLADLRPREVLEDVGDETADWPDLPVPAAPAIILYTSGSTGEPKGAVLSHAALEFAIRSWAEPVMALTPDDVVLAVLPLSHSFGLNGALLAPLLAGARVVFVEHFVPEAVLDAIARHRVTILPAVATMFRRLLDCPALAGADLSSLRLALSGAAPCPWSLAEEWRERTGVRILRGYGSTELFRPISYLAGDPHDAPDAIGRPVPGVEVRVVDDDGRALPAGEPGELWIRTPAAMDGYLNRPDDTRGAFADGAWFRTGDLATVSPDQLVRIVGRKKELILRGGYSVVPAEVEATLLGHPAVREAAVIGVPHPELGEEVAAFVTLHPGSPVEPVELLAYCRERLASYKAPRRITVLDELPRGATGKILKSQLLG